MHLLYFLAVLHLSILRRGWLGAIALHLIKDTDIDADSELYEFVFGIIHGWFFTSLAILYYLHKLGLITTNHSVFPHKKSSAWKAGYMVGITIEIKGVMFLVTTM